MKKLEQAIFEIQSQADFEKIALEVYEFQREKCKVYRDFVHQLNRKQPQSISEIPFLPISFFKSHEVRSGQKEVQTLFMSSGTTGSERSKHFVESLEMYEKSFFESYIRQIGNPENQIILALLPNYIEQGNSSLVYMVDHLIKASKNKLSGFYLDNLTELIQAYETAILTGKDVVIFGVSYALLDLAELKPNLSKAKIIETGGMKGKRKELSKEELHEALKTAFQVPFISSEYGMSELLSQAYSDKNGLFDLPNWMQILIRDVNDPFAFLENEKTGGVNVIDLANLYSCAFIATQDLGKITQNQLQLMGRYDHSDVRGCNLMIE
jgi:phenylacetate-coenzyme A ligase PaaK-like adenylate-forming protein